jgi:hypothetical protein
MLKNPSKNQLKHKYRSIKYILLVLKNSHIHQN